MHTYMCTCLLACICEHVHTCIHTHMPCIAAHLQTCRPAYVHAYLGTCIHTYVHTYIIHFKYPHNKIRFMRVRIAGTVRDPLEMVVSAYCYHHRGEEVSREGVQKTLVLTPTSNNTRPSKPINPEPYTPYALHTIFWDLGLVGFATYRI